MGRQNRGKYCIAAQPRAVREAAHASRFAVRPSPRTTGKPRTPIPRAKYERVVDSLTVKWLIAEDYQSGPNPGLELEKGIMLGEYERGDSSFLKLR